MKNVYVQIDFDEGCLEYFLPLEKTSVPGCCSDFICESETPQIFFFSAHDGKLAHSY